MTVVVLDTDVISGLVKKNLPASLNAKLVGHQLITTFVSAGELERWVIQRDLGRPDPDARPGEPLPAAGPRSSRGSPARLSPAVAT